MLNESETAPIGSTMTPRQVRYLKIAIAIMTFLLIAGFILLIYGLFAGGGKKADEQAASSASIIAEGAPPALLELAVEPGADIASVLTAQGRLIVHLRKAGGGEIAIIDLASGREIQRIRLAQSD
ncbi:MAG: hypothetical protein KTR19_08075 [Hyphomicrobiales bacterium]|nr:hypothetical protein [Hyphomicrobiales bacterium]